MPLKFPTSITSSDSFEKVKEALPEVTEPQNKKSQTLKITFDAIEPKYSISDVIVDDRVKEEISTVINSKKNWDKVFVEWGLGRVLKQNSSLFVNLFGEPGTGKTMCAHVIANELGKKIICVNYADIESKYVGETSKNLTNLFEYAQKNDYVIFFDEADALLSKRVTNMNNSTDVSVNQTRSVLLTLLNDYSGVVVFATNFITNFDSAFMRRIHFHIKFELPNEELRNKLWRMYIPKEMPACVDISEISRKYENISGSDISTAILKAALKAANESADIVLQVYFEEAIESIIESKKANTAHSGTTVTKRIVSEEYAMQQLKEQGNNS